MNPIPRVLCAYDVSPKLRRDPLLCDWRARREKNTTLGRFGRNRTRARVVVAEIDSPLNSKYLCPNQQHSP